MKAHRVYDGFRGIVRTIDDYEKVKNGELDWKPHVKRELKDVVIPYEVFVRLMELDKEMSNNR